MVRTSYFICNVIERQDPSFLGKMGGFLWSLVGVHLMLAHEVNVETKHMLKKKKIIIWYWTRDIHLLSLFQLFVHLFFVCFICLFCVSSLNERGVLGICTTREHGEQMAPHLPCFTLLSDQFPTAGLGLVEQGDSWQSTWQKMWEYVFTTYQLKSAQMVMEYHLEPTCYVSICELYFTNVLLYTLLSRWKIWGVMHSYRLALF